MSYVRIKDPDAVLDFPFKWGDWLDPLDDTIESAEIVDVDGVTVDAYEVDPTKKKVVVWLSGGELGARASITCRITTHGGRTDDRTLTIKIKER